MKSKKVKNAIEVRLWVLLAILLFLLGTIFFLTTFVSAKPITLVDLEINGTFCSDEDISSFEFYPVDFNGELVETDYFQVFFQPNNSYLRDISNIYKNPDNSYSVLVNFSSLNLEEIRVFGKIGQQGKEVKRDKVFQIQKCVSKKQQIIQGYAQQLQQFLNQYWEFILLWAFGLIALIALAVIINQLKS